MKSFRFARRSFLGAVGGAFGLRVLLDNMVASAAGATSPPRFLMTHWPLGTVRYLFRPTGSGSSYTASPIIQPFVDAGLRQDMTVLYGLAHKPILTPQGGAHEAGTVMMTTGHDSPGTRENGGERDDAVAGGPSFDQIFLKRAPSLKVPGGMGYANSICDARVDSYETSTQCLSYSYDMHTVKAAGSETFLSEATPLLPELSPRQQYLNIFSKFMPGGATDPNLAALALARQKRKSVLDFSLRELDRLKALAPASEHVKIEHHAEAIRKAELALEQPLNPGGACVMPSAPDAAMIGERGNRSDYGASAPAMSDEAIHAQVGSLHMGVLIAAFQCDLLRVATFQWSPGENHLAFRGLYPGSDGIYLHHPSSHKVTTGALNDTSPGGTSGDVLQFLANVQTWYNTQHASLLLALRNAKDAFGNSLLDYTVVPYLTEIASCDHHREPLPAFIFGGKALGMQHGTYQNFEGNLRHHNDLWMTIAQAYLGANPLSQLGAETFYKTGVSPIAGLWTAP